MSLSSINWRAREQARKQAAEDTARRRAVEVSEISFPSLTPSTEWGAAPAAAPAPRTWAPPAVQNDKEQAEHALSSKPSARPSYAPTVVISRAKIAEEIRKSSMQYEDNDSYYEEPAVAQKPLDDDDGGWKEVTVRRRSAAQPTTKSRMAEPPQKQQYDDYEDDY